MADVSHELGALRFVVESPLSSKVAMFNNQVSKHQENQHLNPFSQAGGLPRPQFNKGEYGKPLAGSLTEARGQRANIHVLKEMLELCQIIDSEGYSVKDEPTMKVIPFGELFNIYTYISDKVVGILLRARKHKLIEFEGEVLFQHRDEDVPVFLLKPIKEIRQILDQKQDDIRRSVSPAPQATSVILDQQKQRPSPSPSPSPKPKPKASKKKEDSNVDIVKPIAQKAVPASADPPKIEVQSILEPAAQEGTTSPAPVATPKVEPEQVAPAQIAPAQAAPAPVAPAQAAPAATVPAEAEVAPAKDAAPAEVSVAEAPKESLPSLKTELPQSPPKSSEVIAPVPAPVPVTIVTPPTPTAESAPVAVALTSAVNESVPAIVEEKTDLNNNEEAPAIVVSPSEAPASLETSPNTAAI